MTPGVSHDLSRDPASQHLSPPLLSVAGFEAPLDWLVDNVRQGRIDLAQLPVAALVDAFATALQAALTVAGRHSGTLGRWSVWLLLAADLALLRSRLLLPAADAGPAWDRAETLRDQIVHQAGIAAAADWLDRRPQLGRQIWRRGKPGLPLPGRTGDVTALFRACLPALLLPSGLPVAFQSPRRPSWSVSDASTRIRATLVATGIGQSTIPLDAFLPAIPPDTPGYDLRCRTAVANTLLASLELARDHTLHLDQTQPFGAIQVQAR